MKLADLFDHFIIDLDGVVYIGDKPTDGAIETIATLRGLGKTVIFLTNDPRGSCREYAEKLNKMGIQALKEEIAEIGLILTQGEEAKRSDFVIVGGHQGFNYEEMKIATIAIRNGAHFFATNRDPVFPTPEGLVPATGAILASIEYATGKKATIVGKPEVIIFEVAKKFLSSHERVAIVGDRLDTDILGGKRAGITTIFTLSGSIDQDVLSKSDIIPDYVINDLRDLLKEQ